MHHIEHVVAIDKATILGVPCLRAIDRRISAMAGVMREVLAEHGLEGHISIRMATERAALEVMMTSELLDVPEARAKCLASEITAEIGRRL